jgi:hypothetical protein
MGIETAIVGSALIGAGSSFLGNRTAANAANRAAQQQEQIRSENAANARPYMDAGGTALKSYMDAVGLNGSSSQAGYFSALKDDPGYSRVLDAGNDAIMKRQAALGMGGNQANTLAAISDYSGNLRNQFDQQRLSQLGGLVDTGRTSAASLAQTSTASGAQQGALLSQAGQLEGNAYNALGKAANTGMQNYLDYTRYSSGRGGSNDLNRA